MQNIETTLGYTFKNKKLLEQALTHSSLTSDIHLNYERLEFLGDRILGVTIAETLCQTFVNEPEGSLSQRFVGLICKETVAEIMRNLHIEKYINTHTPEIRTQENVLCDVGEALIAAIYLDSGQMSTAQEFIRNNWSGYIDKKSQPHKDYKTSLQEQAHSLGQGQPVYEVIKKSGSEHEPLFLIRAKVGETEAQGAGRSKKAAEQEAAHKLLIKLGVLNDE